MDPIDRTRHLVEERRAGEARGALESLWLELADGEDALARCFLAHALADLQEDPREELRWDLVALDEAGRVTNERAAERNVPGGPVGLYPSLHLNIAEDHRKLGDEAAALEHYEAGRVHLDVLADDDYGRRIRRGYERFDG